MTGTNGVTRTGRVAYRNLPAVLVMLGVPWSILLAVLAVIAWPESWAQIALVWFGVAFSLATIYTELRKPRSPR